MRKAVTQDALTLIKLLRLLSPWRRLQSHLTQCAGYEVLDRAFAPWLPPLRKRHVLGLVALPDADRNAKKLVHLVTETIN